MFSFSELKLDKKALLVLVLSPFCLSIIKYFGNFGFFLQFLENIGLNSLKTRLDSWGNHGGDGNLRHLILWVVVLDLFYLLVPFLFIRYFLKERLADFGMNLRLEKNWWRVYVVFMAVMLPLVYFCSGTASFQSKYPFYHISADTALWPKFWLWEFFYFTQFFCLEFFFRGFMVHGLKPALGYYSIFVMTIPYCMVHFGKPFPETISAIIAGIILGFISYRNKSILLGFLLHISVATAMDLMSLWRQGFFK
jgi:uncharacterized protein